MTSASGMVRSAKWDGGIYAALWVLDGGSRGGRTSLWAARGDIHGRFTAEEIRIPARLWHQWFRSSGTPRRLNRLLKRRRSNPGNSFEAVFPKISPRASNARIWFAPQVMAICNALNAIPGMRVINAAFSAIGTSTGGISRRRARRIEGDLLGGMLRRSAHSSA